MSVFEKVKGNFGFGCMRLPLLDSGEVDTKQFCKMIDEFMEAGLNYFDTARGYLSGKSEKALKECLVDRYPRESYVYVNKLSSPFFKNEEEILPLFESQLEVCGLDYFDIYLMHAQNRNSYIKYKNANAYKIAEKLKKEGRVKHIGLSFHDTADVLDMILTENPNIELVQLQFNYFDYNDEKVQGKECYEVCQKHGKPVVVMEPVRGGSLVTLADDAQSIFDELKGGSNASYANVKMVLSGMSNIEQLRDNVSYMKDFKPLDEKEFDAVWKVADIIKSRDTVPCTACKYCVDGCPQGIKIPSLISCLNTYKQFNMIDKFFYNFYTKDGGKASSCIECGECEDICQQQINIR